MEPWRRSRVGSVMVTFAPACLGSSRVRRRSDGESSIEESDPISDGDSDFLAVLESEHALLVRVAYSVLRNEDDANDVLSDAVAKTYAKWRRGRVDDLPKYLTRTVKNTAIGLTRKRRYQLRALQLLAAEAVTSSTFDESSERAGYDSTQLRAKLDALSPDCRTIIQLRIYEQLPVKDVAAQLFIPEGTVKSRCSRCLKQLGRNLGA